MNKNNFSYWFPKIKDCGIRVPKSRIFIVPEELQECFCLERPTDQQNIIDWVNETVVPEMTNSLYFIKNAVFSNKFDFSHCITRKGKIAEDIAAINYESMCLDANGYDELILREYIPYNSATTPTIYNGMPLRSEFRVFYDFDARKLLYSVNYWDYDYVAPHIYSKTDKIIFEYMREELDTLFKAKKAKVEALVSQHMQTVDLQGKWSIDILYIKENDDQPESKPARLNGVCEIIEERPKGAAFWLIDMAEAERSAYWKSGSYRDNE